MKVIFGDRYAIAAATSRNSSPLLVVHPDHACITKRYTNGRILVWRDRHDKSSRATVLPQIISGINDDPLLYYSDVKGDIQNEIFSE